MAQQFIYIHTFNRISKTIEIQKADKYDYELIKLESNNYSYCNHIAYIIVYLKDNIKKARINLIENKKLFETCISQLEFYTDFDPYKIHTYYIDILSTLIIIYFNLVEIINEKQYDNNERLDNLWQKINAIMDIFYEKSKCVCNTYP